MFSVIFIKNHKFIFAIIGRRENFNFTPTKCPKMPYFLAEDSFVLLENLMKHSVLAAEGSGENLCSFLTLKELKLYFFSVWNFVIWVGKVNKAESIGGQRQRRKFSHLNNQKSDFQLGILLSQLGIFFFCQITNFPTRELAKLLGCGVGGLPIPPIDTPLPTVDPKSSEV